MSRNFDLGTRDMASAGRIALARVQRAGGCSFSTVATVASRWSQFCEYAKFIGVGRMERINGDIVIRYAAHLKDLILEDELAVSTGQNYLSAINTVMHAVTNWKSVNPVADCSMAKRNNIRTIPPASNETINFAIQTLNNSGLKRQALMASLAFQFGLRSKESSLVDYRNLLKKAQRDKTVLIHKGTKGGRKRQIPLTSDEQINTLICASDFDSCEAKLIPDNQAWSVWRDGGLRDGRQILINCGLTGYHELRAAYACTRYKSLTGYPAPCFEGFRLAGRNDDLEARYMIAEELGHGRIDVTGSYLGSRK